MYPGIFQEAFQELLMNGNIIIKIKCICKNKFVQYSLVKLQTEHFIVVKVM